MVALGRMIALRSTSRVLLVPSVVCLLITHRGAHAEHLGRTILLERR